MKRPRLLLALDSIEPCSGGIQAVARMMARSLCDLHDRIEVRAIARTAGRHLAGEVDFPIWSAGRQRWLYALRKTIEDMRADHIICDHLGTVRNSLWPPTRRACSAFIHGIEIWPESAPRKRIDTAQRIGHLISNSRFTAEKARRCIGEVATDIRLCPLATETDDPPLELANPLLARPSVLIVGRMKAGRDKGHRDLIACWPEIVSRQTEATLDIVGDGDDRAALEDLARNSGCGEGIRFHGSIDDQQLQTLMRKACCLAMPSRGEGFGIVYIEAKRAGLPTIGSDVDAAQEVIQHGVDGYIVGAGDRPALGNAILELLEDRQRAYDLGRAGHDDWHERFRFSSFRQRFRDTVMAIVEGS